MIKVPRSIEANTSYRNSSDIFPSDRAIVYLTVTSVPWPSAHSMYVVKMCQAMGELGAKVSLVCCSPRNAPRGALALRPYGIVKPSFRLRQIPAPYGITCFGSQEWDARFYWAALIHALLLIKYKLTKLNHESIFIAHHPISAIACSLLKVQYAYDFHALQFQRPFSQAIIQSHHPKVSFIQSEGLRSLLAPIFPTSNFILARNAVDDVMFDVPFLPLNQDMVTIGYIGDLGADRGIEELLLSFQQLVREESKAHLIIVGGKSYEVERLCLLVAKLALSSYVTIRGYISHEEVIKVLIQCDILVAYYKPTLPAAPYMSPMKLFEYMAAGRAVISSDMATIREFTTHGKDVWLVDPYRPEELTSALFRLYRDPMLRQSLGCAARENPCLMTWKERAKIYLRNLE